MPTTLTLTPQQQGWLEEPGNQVVYIQLDGGEGFFRQDKLGAAGRVNVQWHLTPAEYRYFRAFYRVTIANGSLGFFMDLVIDQPAPARRHLCHFIPRTLRTTVKGITYTVSAQLEVVPEQMDVTEAQEIVSEQNAGEELRLHLMFDQGLFQDYSVNAFDVEAIGTPQPVSIFDADYGFRVYEQFNNNSYLDIPFNITGVVGDTTSYTLLLWYKISAPIGTRVLFSTATSNALQLLLSNSGLTAGHGGVDVGGGNGLHNVWTMAGLTWDKATGQMRLWQNNNVVDSAGGVAGYNTISLQFRAFGRDGSTEGPIGRLNNLRFYNRVLSDNEISQYFTSTGP